jgi:alpha-galactosidase
LRSMNAATKKILLNEEVIALNQDELGKQCERKIKNNLFNVFVKPLKNGDVAVAILNRSIDEVNYALNFSEIGLTGKYEIRDLWEHKIAGKGKMWKGKIQSHETKVFRLKQL